MKMRIQSSGGAPSLCALILCATTALFIATPANATPSFQGLGWLDDETPNSTAFGISRDGTTIVGQSQWASNQTFADYYAFRWTESEGMVNLGHLPTTHPAPSGRAFGASADGSVIVGSSQGSSNVAEAYRWTQETGMVSLGILPGDNLSGAKAVSDDGSVVAGWSRDRAVRWTAAEGMVVLGSLPDGTDAENAFAISADGSVIAGELAGISARAFLWTEQSGVQDIGAFLPQAMTPDGSVVVGGNSRWTAAEGLTSINLSGLSTSVFDISDDGSRIVGYMGGPNQALLWDEDLGILRFQSVLEDRYGLDLGDWTLHSANAISGDGLTLAGYGTNPSGLREAWVARITDTIPAIPEPTTGLLTLLGLGSLVLRRSALE